MKTEDESVHQGRSVSEMAHEVLEKAKTEAMTSRLKVNNAKTTLLLGDLKASLSQMADLKRAQKYCRSIDDIREKAQMPRFVIGVLGDTGTGKSSLINAVLDEERVVPTNCMRACTAVITEILWNPSEDPTKRYCAEIHFITQAEWTKELEDLRQDVLDSNGKLSKDVNNSDSDAGTAYSTLRAVYPSLKDGELERIHPSALASDASVTRVLGSTMVVEEKSCDAFYSKIQAYVDSEENLHNQSMAYWPLVKVVRVFLKSEVLSTGVVIVDLPGGRDSNAVRAAVAAKYTKECTRLWIVAPIARAVNDKTAKTLMGRHFKQQLKYDNSYSSITFICTKTDDIVIKEAAETLGIKNAILTEHENENMLKADTESTRANVKKLEAKKSKLHQKLTCVSKDFDTWYALKVQAERGQPTFDPAESPKKRKRQASQAARKKLRKGVESSDTEDITTDESDQDAESKDEGQSEPLTFEKINAKLQELKANKKSLRDEKRGVKQQIDELNAKVVELRAQTSRVKTGIYRKCIQGRNDYSRTEIQNDFAHGLKELDEEILAEQQQDDQELSGNDALDYDEIGQALPVYCISSRGYQQLRGNMKIDRRVPGFTSLEDTEVPGLRKHTLELAASLNNSYLKHHLSEVCRLLRGMDLFLAGNDALLKMSDTERKGECDHLEKTLRDLGKTLSESVSSCMEECQKAAKKVLNRMPKGASKASAEAVATAKSWGFSGGSGGLRFTTYRATCRRRGVFKGAAGPRDFNADLLKPLKVNIAQSWDQAFNVRIPELLDRLAATSVALINEFHAMMKRRRFLVENNNFVRQSLRAHIVALDEQLVHIKQQHKKTVRDNQRSANRVFYPAIESSLEDTYSQCARASGLGAFIRLRELMEADVDSSRDAMFRKATSDAIDAVNDLIQDLGRVVRRDINEVLSTMEHDYKSIIGTVTDETDNRDRKILQPILEDFYEKLLVALITDEEQTVTPEMVDVQDLGEVLDDDGGSSYHENDDNIAGHESD